MVLYLLYLYPHIWTLTLSIKYLHTSSKYGRLVPLTEIVRLVLSQQITLTKGLRLPPGS